MKLLLSKGANVNAEGEDGITPLHVATQFHGAVNKLFNTF